MGAFKVNDLVVTVRDMVSHECPAFSDIGAVKVYAESSEISFRLRRGLMGIVRASANGVLFVDFAEPGVAARQVAPADIELTQVQLENGPKE